MPTDKTREETAMVTGEANSGTSKIILFLFTLILMVLFFFSPRTLFPRESGFKYIRNYSPKEYDHKPQNWSILQDENGIIYVGNNGGLLNYDGVSWRLLLIRNWNVRSLAADRHGAVYIGGKEEIGYAAPFSVFDKRSNLPGLVQTVTRHGPHGVLYTGTTSGLYYFVSSESPGSPGEFRPVPGVSGMCWSLLSIEDSLLVATDNGVFQLVTKDNLKRKVSESRSYVLLQSQTEPNRTWVGTGEGLFSLYFKNENGIHQWTTEHHVKEITEEIRTIVEDKEGNLWLGTLTKGVLKADFTGEGNVINPVVTSYATSHGLPAGEVHVFWGAGHVIFATRAGIFRFDREKNIFSPDTTLGDEYAGGPDGRSIHRIVEDTGNTIWLHSRLRNIQAAPGPDQTFVLNEKPFFRVPTAQVNAIYPDPDGNTIWFGGDEGLVRYDTQVKKNYTADFKTLIRKIEVNGNLFFDGNKSKRTDTSHPKPPVPVIDYKDRNVRFEFAAPYFEDESATQYRCLLEGYDDQWSDWSDETRKDYTNLDSGMYTFRVRARNVYLHESNESVYMFNVLPPWYKTWWAFSINVFLLFVLMFLIIKWRSGKLEREKQKLEQTVKNRTKEVNQKNRQLEDQTGQLKEQAEKLKEMDNTHPMNLSSILKMRKAIHCKSL